MKWTINLLLVGQAPEPAPLPWVEIPVVDPTVTSA